MKYFFLAILIILVSCGQKKKPDNLIEPPKMIKILSEVHLLEAKVGFLKLDHKDSAQYVYNHFEELLFDSLGVSKTQYEISYNYYLENTSEFVKIYEAVVDSLLQIEKTSN